MSKVSFSRELLGTIRFVFDKTKSRSLNATQAYDTSPSQIVLASYPASATIKGPTKGLGKVVRDDIRRYGSVAVNATTFASPLRDLTVREAEVAIQQQDPQTITLGWMCPRVAAVKKTTVVPNDTAIFSSASWYVENLSPFTHGPKSNATKEIFAGNITVGTGLYRDWQNKYAVLKVDLLTDKAILRVYNE